MNLLNSALSYNFLYWDYTQSTLGSGGTQAGITVSTALYENPTLTSNLTTQLIADSGSFGGVSTPLTLSANTTYTISFYAFGVVTSSGFALRLTNTPIGGAGILYWNGPSTPLGYNQAGDAYAYPTIYTSGTIPYTLYTWVITTPNNFLSNGSLNNAILSIITSGACSLSFYGLNVNIGSSVIPYVEPTIFAFDTTSLPLPNNYITPYIPYYLSVDLFNSSGTLTTAPFDYSRLANTSLLGKNVFPYGNTFGKLLSSTSYSFPGGNVIGENLTISSYAYYVNPNADLTLLDNTALGPIDAVNNPANLGYTASLIQPSADIQKLIAYSGGTISWTSVPEQILGNTYTISLWLKSKYLVSTGTISISPGGNWVTGIQSPGSEGNLADSSWKTLNGTYSIILHSDTNNAGLVNDEGIPSESYIPPAHLLFTKRADQILAEPANGSSPVYIESYINNTVYEISTTLESTLPTDVLAAKYGTIIYQEVPYSATINTYNYDFWAKIAQDTLITGSGGSTSVYIDPTITANIISWAMIYPMLDGTTLTVLYKWYDTLQGDNWRYQQNIGNLTYSSTLQDFTKPVGFGFVFSGKLSVYGGIRIYDANTMYSAPFVLSTTDWTRISLTYTASETMANTLHFNDEPGSTTGSFFSNVENIFNINIFQPAEPTPNTSYLPWSPIWSSFYAYGLMITEGTDPGIYFPDAYSLASYSTSGIASTSINTLPTISYQNGTIPVQLSGIPAWSDTPHHPIGINVTGANSYSASLIFLNLMKLSTAGKVKTINDPAGVWVDSTVHGWSLYRSLAVNGIDTSFNVLDTAIVLKSPTFVTGATTMTTLVSDGDQFWLFNPVNLVRTLTGIGVATNTHVVSFTMNSANTIITWVVDTPFIGNSSGSYLIHVELIDNISAMSLDADGYPTTVPTGYSLYCLIYRSTPLSFMMKGISVYDMPYQPSGLYTLSWEGTGVVSLGLDISMVPLAYPVVEVSRTSNSITYSVDCSGNTSTGVSTSTKSCYGLTTTIPITDSQTGFVVAISSTDPAGVGDYIRNIQLYETSNTALIESGEIFYPSFLDRLRDFKCLRFLDWTKTNAYQSLTTISGLTTITEVSWVNNNMVPYEVIINLCNTLQKDCWINLIPYSTDGDAFYLYIANLFQTTLDSNLRLYIEYGNEQWNGGLGTGWWLNSAAQFYNIVSPYVNPPNPAWYNEMFFYAMQSQYVFGIFDGVFSGSKSQLQPVRLWDTPKTQKRRLLRCLSTMINGASITSQIWQFALLFTKGAYGIPYDIITPNAYIDILNDPTVVANSTSAYPNEYSWTMADLIPIYWNQLNIQTTDETNATAGIIYKQNLTGYPTGVLGTDTDGDQFNPIICFYEGGMGSAGPTPHMLQSLTDLLFEYDTPLNTVYNISLTQLHWWTDTMIPMFVNAGADADSAVYNIWETAGNWSGSDQWGIADKSLYTDAEYYNFPKARLYNQSAGRVGTANCTINVAGSQQYVCQPSIWMGTEWVPMVDFMVYTDANTWVLSNSTTLNCRLDNTWSNSNEQ